MFTSGSCEGLVVGLAAGEFRGEVVEGGREEEEGEGEGEGEGLQGGVSGRSGTGKGGNVV